MTLWRTVSVGIATAILIMGLSSAVWAGDARQNLSQDSTLEKVLKRETLRVGFSTFKPWAMKGKNGEFIGFEIDVAKRLASDMGVKVRFIPTKWDGIIPALLTGKFDIIIGGMGITPKRNLKVNFSDPYEFSGMSIVANKMWLPENLRWLILIMLRPVYLSVSAPQLKKQLRTSFPKQNSLNSMTKQLLFRNC